MICSVFFLKIGIENLSNYRENEYLFAFVNAVHVSFQLDQIESCNSR